jgi:hypothetical protein
MRRLDSLETAKDEAFKKAVGTATDQVECRSKSVSRKRIENSVPYGSKLDFICWALEDTGLDGELARLGRLSSRHS